MRLEEGEDLDGSRRACKTRRGARSRPLAAPRPDAYPRRIFFPHTFTPFRAIAHISLTVVSSPAAPRDRLAGLSPRGSISFDTKRASQREARLLQDFLLPISHSVSGMSPAWVLAILPLAVVAQPPVSLAASPTADLSAVSANMQKFVECTFLHFVSFLLFTSPRGSSRGRASRRISRRRRRTRSADRSLRPFR